MLAEFPPANRAIPITILSVRARNGWKGGRRLEARGRGQGQD